MRTLPADPGDPNVKTLLQIQSSLDGQAGVSATLAAEYASAWRARVPHGRIVVRDLVAEPLPHLTAERFRAFITRAEVRTPAQRAVVAESDRLIAEMRAADEIVLALPMYNFGIPSQLKSWFDHVARAGVTFRYTPAGAEGLIGERRVLVIAARGSRYQGTDADHQTPHVRQFFALLGMKSLDFVYVEGLAISPEARAAALADARAQFATRLPAVQAA
jgi:FMN-dependent NADH-azoreductase